MTPSIDLLHEPPAPEITSAITRRVARLFRLKPATTSNESSPIDGASLVPSPGQILLVLGASGSGKSTLLAAMRSTIEDQTHLIDPSTIDLRASSTLACFDLPDDADDQAVRDVLRRLCSVGLAEAWTWMRSPDQLSDGQRWRLRLALALWRVDRCHQQNKPPSRTLLIVDEFACVLDRVTAILLARTLRREVDRRRERLCAIVATVRHDLESALTADHIARCDFGNVRIQRGARR